MGRSEGGVKVVHKKNGGLPNAWNDGLRLAAGEYITFVDSDDWLELNYYEEIFSGLSGRKADVFCSGGRFIERDGKTEVYRTLEEPFFYKDGTNRAYLMARTLVRWPADIRGDFLCDLGYVWDKIYRTTFIRENGLGWDPQAKYGPWLDALFELEVFSKAQRTGGCLAVGYHYRIAAGGATNRYYSNLPEICCNFAQGALRLIQDDPAFCEPVLRDAFMGRCQNMLMTLETKYFFHPENKLSYKEKMGIFRELKKQWYFKDALYNSRPRFLTGNGSRKLLLMRLPWLWPLGLVYKTYSAIKQLQNRI